jgi:hypothetical protein
MKTMPTYKKAELARRRQMASVNAAEILKKENDGHFKASSLDAKRWTTISLKNLPGDGKTGHSGEVGAVDGQLGHIGSSIERPV